MLEVSEAQVSQMLREARPSWSLEDSELIKEGYQENTCLKCLVAVDSSTRDCLLKIARRSDEHIRRESRLINFLSSTTRIPVPEIYGRVDHHTKFPTPYFLMDFVPGDHLSPNASDRRVEQVAEEFAQYIAELHSVGNFQTFGEIYYTGDVSGGYTSPPILQPYDLVIGDTHPDWRSWYRKLAMNVVHSLEETSFSDLVPEVISNIKSHVQDLSAGKAPVVSVISHNRNDILLEEETGAIKSIIDWEMGLLLTREYDLVCAEKGLLSGPISVHSDFRETIRRVLWGTYRKEVDRSLQIKQDKIHLYLLVEYLAEMRWVAQRHGTQKDRAGRRYRSLVTELLNGL